MPSTTKAPCSRRYLRLASSRTRFTSGLAALLIVSAMAHHPSRRRVPGSLPTALESRPAPASEVAGDRYGFGGGFPVAGGRDAGALKVDHVDVGGVGRAGGGVECGQVGRPLLVVGQQRRELKLQVSGRVAGDEAGRQRGPADQSAAAGANRLWVALGLLVNVPGHASRCGAGVAVG